MTENEAIEALMSEFEGEANEAVEQGKNQGQPQEIQAKAESKDEAKRPSDSEEVSIKQETKEQGGVSKDDIAAAMVKAMQAMKAEEAKAEAKAEADAQASARNAEQQALLEQMGLGNLGQMQEQFKAMQAQMAEQAEAARRRDVFNKNIEAFEKEFPTINPTEFGKFAEANGYKEHLGEDYKMWQLVANTMLRVAQPLEQPDPIIGNGGGKNEISAFERLKKGEEVSDIEIGAELLKGL